tara:strand:+ start:1412 stop:13663 length:12252 start_codon:yes stop_codon:yes gene_type:complete
LNSIPDNKNELISENVLNLNIDINHEDSLFAFKDYANNDSLISQVDILNDIEVYKLSSHDDSFQLSDNNNAFVVDFNSGNDELIISSRSDTPEISNFYNLEKLIWHPLDNNGNVFVDKENNNIEFDFSIQEWFEDESIMIPIDKFGNNNSWNLQDFSFNTNTKTREYTNDDWIRVEEVKAFPELIGKDKLVISTKYINDPVNPKEAILEIHAHDYRKNGKGLFGLELDIEWSEDTATLNSSKFNKENVFDSAKLPLFQNLGLFVEDVGLINEKIQAIKGLGAASLPVSGQGIALADLKQSKDNTLFARIPFLKNNDNENIDVFINPLLMPAFGGRDVEEEDLIILDSSSPKVSVIKANPTQEQVGEYYFTLSEDGKNNSNNKNIGVLIRPVNDPPEIIPLDSLPNNFSRPIVDQDNIFEFNVKPLFKDVDDENLKYSINASEDWINLDSNNALIYGTPSNENVGESYITIIAEDKKGEQAEQVIKVVVNNINDSPLLNKIINLPELSQVEELTFRLPSNTFVDKDLLIDPNEVLKYEIIPEKNNANIFDWVSVEKTDGTIIVKPTAYNVGTTSFYLRAIDSYGLYDEQLISLNVSNVNDPPVKNQKFDSFIRAQQEIDIKPEESDPNAIFIGLEKEFNINDWFTDPDLDVDPVEELSFKIYYDNGVGDLYDLSKPETFDNFELSWINWDEKTNTLKINPNFEQLGQHFLKINTKDAYDLEMTVILDFLVRHRNTAPIISNFEHDVLVADIQHTGILNFNPLKDIQLSNVDDPNLKGLNIELQEESDFSIKLPSTIFADLDFGIDLNEKLTFEIITDSKLTNSNDFLAKEKFNFNSSELSFYGNTNGLGLNSKDGKAEWESIIRATDNKGLFIDFNLNFLLQRTLSTPELEIISEKIEKQEGSFFQLKDSATLNVEQRNGDILFLEIKQSETDAQDIALFNSSSENNLLKSNPNNKRLWKFSGSPAEISSLFNSLHLKVLNDKHAVGDFNVSIELSSRLGNTSIVSEDIVKQLGFTLLPVPSEPKWLINESVNFDNPVLLKKISSLLTATSDDPREIISYQVNIQNDNDGIFFTNFAGESLGSKSENNIIFSKDQWEEAILRSNIILDENVNLSIKAISTESSVGLNKYSETKEINIPASPYISNVPSTIVFPPQGLQSSDLPSLVEFSVNIPRASKSLIFELDLISGSSLTIDNEEIHLLNTTITNDITKYIFSRTINEEEENINLNFKVNSPDSFKGEFKGSLSTLASVRTIVENVDSLDFLNEDISKSLAKQGEIIPFSWEVIQIAKNPEFQLTDLGTFPSLTFDKKNGKLSVGIRRGEGQNGFRNPSEDLTLAFKNIPSGFTLAEKVGNKYKAVGASDAFGTMSLFPFSGNTEKIDEFTQIQSGNLYLVAKDNSVLNNEVFTKLEGKSIDLSLVSRIIDQQGGDTRSEFIEQKIDLSNFIGNIPVLSPVLVDPLIIDLDSNGLSLISLSEASENNISFEMFPGGEKVTTSWIDKNDNQALIVLNDTSNDSDNGVISIESISEIFSEYFQSKNNLRTFNSGTSALSSLDSNKDNKINKSDEEWESILLWFDDGDAISQSDELKPISDFVESIDLASLETIRFVPTWSKGNSILRKVDATFGENIYEIYDVGLNVSGSSQTNLKLDIQSSNNINSSTDSIHKIELSESGETIPLYLISEGSEKWIDQGLAPLTLVRLSGLPNEIKPTIGVKDLRGDWLFTWADYIANENNIQLIPNPSWSGNSNLSILLSQLQSDGTLISTPITSVALDVFPVPDKPNLKLLNKTIKEDEPLNLVDIIFVSSLNDNDGSEKLEYKLSNLPEGFKLIHNIGSEDEYEISSNNGVYLFDSDIVNKIHLKPLPNFSGPIQFKWQSIATEMQTGESSTAEETVFITITPSADMPTLIPIESNLPVLKEGSSLLLSSLFSIKDFKEILNDKDGSEDLRLYFKIPANVNFKNPINSNWKPLEVNNSLGFKEYLITSNDLNDLILEDEALENIDSFNISINPISREKSNGDSLRGEEQIAEIKFIRNAKKAEIDILDQPIIQEDARGNTLKDFINVKPENKDDLIKYIFSNFSDGLNLINGISEEAFSNETEGKISIESEDIDNWLIKVKNDLSGKLFFELEIESDPNNGGEKAISDKSKINIDVQPVVDTPFLNMDHDPNTVMQINSNGWLDLGSIHPTLTSKDNDGSEIYSLIIGLKGTNGEKIEFPSQTLFNSPFTKLDDFSYEFRESIVSNLKIFLGEINENIIITLEPCSKEGGELKKGQLKTLEVESNVIVRVPLLEVTTLQSSEDIPFPILASNNGPIKARLRGSESGQNLELEISNLPQESKLVRINDLDSTTDFHLLPAINQNNNGELLSNFRLPYNQWGNIYWLNPYNKPGLYNFNTKAISVGDKNSLSTDFARVDIITNAINDKPIIIDSTDLPSVKENDYFEIDLLKRFNDIDNENNKLVIEIKKVNDSGELVSLPEWLQFESNGLLKGTPLNKDVGIVKLHVSATDPLGLKNSFLTSLQVGNINASPVIDIKYLEGWNEIIEDNSKVYLLSQNIDLRESINLNLNKVFNDEDAIHGDQLNFKVKLKGQDSWSDDISSLALIDEEKKLIIFPNEKDYVGTNNLLIKASDLNGSSTFLELRFQVNNINDPPLVNRTNEGEALLVANGFWEESIKVRQSNNEWQFNLEGLFKDNDISDRIEVVDPILFPSWIEFTQSVTNTGGILSGVPLNDVTQKIYPLIWEAYDNSGAKAKYKLNIEAINLNDKPILKTGSNLLDELGTIYADGSAEILEDNYSSLNLSNLFDDPDLQFGDKLNYEVTSINNVENNKEIDPSWAKITYKSSEVPNSENKLLIQPVLYEIDDEGKRSTRLNISELDSLPKGSKIRVNIEVTDKRDIAKKGLTVADIDFSFNSYNSFVNDSVKISDKFTFDREITDGNKGLRIKAGSAPALGIGEPIGDTPQESLFEFDLLVSDPSKGISITVNPGIGLNREGIIGRNILDGELLNSTNTVIHSLSNRDQADLEILAPDNDFVGIYDINLKAIDSELESVEKKVTVRITNVNDEPFNVAVTKDQNGNIQTDRLRGLISGQYKEGIQNDRISLKVADDPDLKHGNEEIFIELLSRGELSEFNESIKQDSIKFSSTKDGELILDINAPNGLNKTKRETISFKFADKEGKANQKYYTTDEYSILFIPTSTTTPLKKEDNISLEKMEIGKVLPKDIKLRLSDALGINAPEIEDSQGDEAFINLLVNSANAKLSSDKDINMNFYTSKLINPDLKQTLLTIDLNKLEAATNSGYGNLQDLFLDIDYQQLEVFRKWDLIDSVPDNLKNTLDKNNIGIPLSIYTTTRVKGDELATFGISESKTSNFWIPLINSSPIFSDSKANKIVNVDVDANQNQLFDLKEVFSDPKDNLIFEARFPKTLAEYIQEPVIDGKIKWKDNIDLKNIPEGSYKIFVRCIDSSGLLGDKKGFENGILRLIINNNNVDKANIAGLDLINRSTTTELSRIYSNLEDPQIELSQSEQEVVEILNRFNVNNSEKREEFFNNLEKGSLSILGSPSGENTMLYLDSSRDEGTILRDASQVNITDDVIVKTNQMLDDNDLDIEINNAPLGIIDFNVDTQGDRGSFIELFIEDNNVALDSIVKTNEDNNPFIFKSNVRNDYDEEIYGDLESYLQTLPYQLYYYSENESSNNIQLPSITFDSDISNELIGVGFDIDNDISNIDGSSYLIDLDNDGITDLITLLVLDEGFFDTQKGQLGVIGDPLIPIETQTIETSFTVPNQQDEINSNQSSDNSNESSEVININNDINKDLAAKAIIMPSDSQDQAADNPYINTSQNIDKFNPKSSENNFLDSTFSNLYNKVRNRLSSIFSGFDVNRINKFGNSNSKNANETSDEYFINPSDKSLSIATFMGFILAPFIAERTLTQAAKNIKTDFNLSIRRRSPLFKGEWVFPSRTEKFLVVQSNKSNIKFKYINSQDKNVRVRHEGFTKENQSLLSLSIPLCKKPGSFFNSLIKTRSQLLNGQVQDIDWDSWLLSHFVVSEDNIENKTAIKAFYKLQSLTRRQDLGIDFLDMIMFAQIDDCYSQMHFA